MNFVDVRTAELDFQIKDNWKLTAENEYLKDENSKLQELVAKLYRCARWALRDLAPSCVDESKDGCGMDCTDNGEDCCMTLLEQRMRELGIEVPEWADRQ
jgi:hypothetical protein